jgi:branched-chain amino acid transport system ATP-binding protein
VVRDGLRQANEASTGGATAGAGALLQVDGLACSYGGIDVLHGVDMKVGAGEAVCLVGPNGAGKTTLAKAVTGLVRPTAGDVRFDGVTLNRLRASDVTAHGVAIVLEGRHVFVEQSVRANLQLGAYRRRLRRPELEEELEKVYGLFGDLRRFETKLAGSLSGGQQQMLCVGRALMSAPRLLILDEPSMGLSPKLASELYATMTQLRGEGLTILLIEQNAELAFRFCSRGYVLQQGSIVVEGTVDELRSTDLVRRIYMGDDRVAPTTGARAREEEAR